MRRRKPRGQIGYVTLAPDPRFHAVELPDGKEEIEQWIVDHALSAAGADAPTNPFRESGKPVRNPESDFDFTLPTPSGNHYLDLMEVVVLPKDARGYEDGVPSYDAEAMAEAVFDKVRSKSRHYGGRHRATIHLLLYATDWRFQLLPPVVEHLTLCLARRRHAFRTVSFFEPHSADQGQFVGLFPAAPGRLEEYAERAYEARQRGTRKWILIPDPREMRRDAASGVVWFRPPEIPKPRA